VRTELLYRAVAASAAGGAGATASLVLRVAGLNLLLAVGASLSVCLISPAAAGSGIPDVKAFLNGADTPREVFRDFFTLRTFAAKVLGSALAVASSLAVGKEGPMLHAGSILAVLLGRHGWFRRGFAGERGDAGAGADDEDDNGANESDEGHRTRDNHGGGGGDGKGRMGGGGKGSGNEGNGGGGGGSYGCYGPAAWGGGGRDLRDLVACGAACGVTTAFRAPVGGVLFAMEVSTRWSKELTWRCFLAAAVSVLAVRASVAACAARGLCGQLRWSSLAYLDAAYPPSVPLSHAPQLLLLAAAGGYAGAMFTALNTWVCLARRRWRASRAARVAEVAALSLITSAALLSLPLVAGRCAPCRTGDPDRCVGGGAASFRTFRGYGCPAGSYNDLAALTTNPQGFLIQALFAAPPGALHVGSLAAFGALYFLLAALAYGAFIPSGLFTVGLIFGGCLGRVWADALAWAGALDHPSLSGTTAAAAAGAGAGAATNTSAAAAAAAAAAASAADAGARGMYALLGAAAFLGGLMRMSASMCLILMEMTGAPQMLPYLMVTLVVAKGVGDRFNYSVFDHQMILKGLGVVGMGGGGEPDKAVARTRLTAGDVMLAPRSPPPPPSGARRGREGETGGAASSGAAADLAAAAPGAGGGGGGGELGKGRALLAAPRALRVLETRAAVAAALEAHRDAPAFPVCALGKEGGDSGDGGEDGDGGDDENGSDAGPAFLGMVSRGALLDLLRQQQPAGESTAVNEPHQQQHQQQQQQQRRRRPDGALLNLAPRVEAPPVVVPPSMPLAFVYALMQDQGLDCLPVIRQHGPLEGLITRCGCCIDAWGAQKAGLCSLPRLFFLFRRMLRPPRLTRSLLSPSPPPPQKRQTTPNKPHKNTQARHRRRAAPPVRPSQPAPPPGAAGGRPARGQGVCLAAARAAGEGARRGGGGAAGGGAGHPDGAGAGARWIGGGGGGGRGGGRGEGTEGRVARGGGRGRGARRRRRAGSCGGISGVGGGIGTGGGGGSGGGGSEEAAGGRGGGRARARGARAAVGAGRGRARGGGGGGGGGWRRGAPPGHGAPAAARGKAAAQRPPAVTRKQKQIPKPRAAPHSHRHCHPTLSLSAVDVDRQ